MATTNIWQQFKALIPEGGRFVATITAKNGNGINQAALRDGSVISVKGESVNAGEKAFILDGEIRESQACRSMRWRFETIKNRFCAQFYRSL